MLPEESFDIANKSIAVKVAANYFGFVPGPAPSEDVVTSVSMITFLNENTALVTAALDFNCEMLSVTAMMKKLDDILVLSSDSMLIPTDVLFNVWVTSNDNQSGGFAIYNNSIYTAEYSNAELNFDGEKAIYGTAIMATASCDLIAGKYVSGGLVFPFTLQESSACTQNYGLYGFTLCCISRKLTLQK